MPATESIHFAPPEVDSVPRSEVEDPAGRPDLSLQLYSFSCALPDVSLDILEEVSLALTPRAISEIFEANLDIQELLLIRTCQRVELCCVTSPGDGRSSLTTRLPHSNQFLIRSGPEVIWHLLRVGAGAESIAVGEREVLSQLRRSSRSILTRHPRPILAKLLDGIAHDVENTSRNGEHAPSVGMLAAELVIGESGRDCPNVLIVGAGVVGRQVAVRLAAKARLTIAYHSRPPEGEFTREVRARMVPIEQVRAEISGSNAVVTAAKLGGRLLSVDDVRSAVRPDGLLIVDLGVPRNVDPLVRRLPGVEVVDLSDLLLRARKRVDDPTPPTPNEARVSRLYAAFQQNSVEPLIGAFFRNAERVRREELARATRFLGPLTLEQQSALDRLTQRLLGRVLGVPASRLRAAVGTNGEAIRRVALELFREETTIP